MNEPITAGSVDAINDDYRATHNYRWLWDEIIMARGRGPVEYCGYTFRYEAHDFESFRGYLVFEVMETQQLFRVDCEYDSMTGHNWESDDRNPREVTKKMVTVPDYV